MVYDGQHVIMWCSALTTLSVLCLTSYLPIVVGNTRGQRNSQGSETNENVALLNVSVDEHETLDGSNGKWNDSQPSLFEENDTSETLQKNTNTSLIWDGVITTSQGITPVVLNQLVLTVGPQEDAVTTPQENITTSPLENTTTLQEDISTSQEGGSKQNTKIIVTEPLLEDGKVPIRVNQFVICSCPELTPNGCRRFLSETFIDSKDDMYKDIRKPVADLNIVMHNVTCLKKNHRLMNFSEGSFFFRKRGDLVLRNVGDLNGLRVSDYCADLHNNKHGDIEWNVKICVAPPSVPRCCPDSQALKDGVCKDATTPTILDPPLPVALNKKPINWPVLENHYHPLTCTEHPLTSVPLVPHESYLVSVPSGILHIWDPLHGNIQRQITYPPDLCIDGYQNSDGSVVYSANICYSNPEEFHSRVCDGHTCVRKCCNDDEEMSLVLYRCIPSNLTAYKPQFTSPPYEYKVVNGNPLCKYQRLIDNVTIDSTGHLHVKDDVLSARDYCVDKFNDGLGKSDDKARVCIKERKGWAKARRIVFAICQMISVVFLMLTAGCYCLVPELLQDGGWYQLFHVLSLMLAYATMFAQEMFSKTWDINTCIIMGIVLQFGFLAAFFWLNVLCVEVWKKIRSLNKFLPASIIPIWIYMLYAFGVPIGIGVLTVCMQLFVPDGVPGVVKPQLAVSTCFFSDTTTVLLYFYGPIAVLLVLNIVFIAHTSWTLRKFVKKSELGKNSSETICEREMPMNDNQCNRNYISDFRQQFSLLMLMSLCWATEILSYLIPLIELWAVTDLLNTLQGVFIFFIFIAHSAKRKHLRKKFPLFFKIANYLKNAICPCCCQGRMLNKVKQALYSSFTSQVNRKSSPPSIFSNVSTSSKLSTSSSSVIYPNDTMTTV